MTKLIDRPPIPPPPGDDPFPYGWRYVTQTRPDGTTEYVQVPLTVEDLLHPQEGDVIPENTVQEKERGYFSAVFRYQLTGQPSTLVLSDCVVEWGIEGMKSHSPDVSVFENVREPDRNYGTFPVVEQGARALLAIEIVSPRNKDPRVRQNDVATKVDEYHRIGIPLYLIVDQEREGGPRRLILHRWAAARYEVVPPDDQGRFLLDPVRVLVGMRENRVVCYDAATGKEFGDYAAVATAGQAAEEARKAAEEARKAAEDHARAAEEARKAADANARAQAEARQAAEDYARAQAEAQKAAEEKLRVEAEARKAAEERVRIEAEARKGAEDKLRALEEELQRLRRQASNSGPASSSSGENP
jgi:Uma2 family endonuclease